MTERNGGESTGPLAQDIIAGYLDACMKGDVDEVKKILKGKIDDQMLQLLQATKEIEGRKRTGLGLAFNQHHFEVVAEVVTFISKSECRKNIDILCVVFPYTGALQNQNAKAIDNLPHIPREDDQIKALKATTKWGWTPLIVASAMYDNEEVVKALLGQLRKHNLLETVVLRRRRK